MPFFAICILQHLFGSHSASTTEKISVINCKEGGIPYYQNNLMYRGNLARPSLLRLGGNLPSLVGPCCRGKFSFLTFQCRAQEQYIYLNSSWAQKRVKKGREVLTYDRPVIPGPAQPKTVTVCLCLACRDRGTSLGQGNGGF